eukprot:scaffold2238_cov145-Skeletonema_menzelii.AAC.6
MRSDIAASKYFAKIKSVYMDHCLAFMGNEYLDYLDSIEASLWMNTNIIDDVDSIMSIHPFNSNSSFSGRNDQL